MNLKLQQKQQTNNVLTVILCLLAIFQAPVFYYFTSGLLSMFIVLPYLLFALSLTIILIRPKKNGKSIFQKLGVVLSICFGIFSLFWGSALVEKLDWKYYKTERQSIVEKALRGEYENGQVHFDYFPPISNGGNEVYVENRADGVTVMFYIDRGFVDHYSAFIYTTNKMNIKRFEKRVNANKKKKNIELDSNWYRIGE